MRITNACKSGMDHLLLIGVAALLSLVSGCATTNSQDNISSSERQKQVIAALENGDEALRNGELDQATIAYVNVLEHDPENAEAYYKLATIHSTKGNLDVAETSYQKVLSISPDHAGAHEGLGIVLLKERKYGESKAHLLQAIEKQSDIRWQAYNSLAVINDLEGKYQQAENYYTKALEIKPTSAMVLNNAGYNQYLANDWEAALWYFEKAVANDPKHKKAWSNLGLVHTRLTNYEQAISAFTQIMSKPHALNNVGYLCMIDGKEKIAEQYFNEAIKQSPSYFELAHKNREQLYARKDTKGYNAEPLNQEGHNY